MIVPLRDDLSLIVAPTPASLAGLAARLAAGVIGDAVAERGRALVALSGGSSPVVLFEALRERHARGLAPALDDPRIAWFQVDERLVPRDDPRRNARLADEHLFAPVGVPAVAIHAVPAEPSLAPDDVARRYEQEIGSVTGAAPGGRPPALDLVLLGLGADGHTASLFPGEPALDEATRWIVPARGPADGAPRVTMTFPLLAAARCIAFFVIGASKRAALRALLHPDVAGVVPPARRVRAAEALLILADAAAIGTASGEDRP